MVGCSYFQSTFPARQHHRPLSGTKLYCLVFICVWTTCPESLHWWWNGQELNSWPLDCKSDNHHQATYWRQNYLSNIKYGKSFLYLCTAHKNQSVWGSSACINSLITTQVISTDYLQCIVYTCLNQFLCSLCVAGQLLNKLQCMATERITFLLRFCIKNVNSQFTQ